MCVAELVSNTMSVVSSSVCLCVLEAAMHQLVHHLRCENMNLCLEAIKASSWCLGTLSRTLFRTLSQTVSRSQNSLFVAGSEVS